MEQQRERHHAAASSSGGRQHGRPRRDGGARRSGAGWQWGTRLLALLSVLATAGQSWAADLVVTTLADSSAMDGDCSLREAITAANTNANVNECTGSSYGNDTITFDSSLTGGTITLGSTLPQIVSGFGTLTIDGEANAITLSGNFFGNILRLSSGASLTVHHLTIANGGGCPDCLGAGIGNAGGTLTVTNSTFANNRTDSVGAGIANRGGTVTVTN